MVGKSSRLPQNAWHLVGKMVGIWLAFGGQNGVHLVGKKSRVPPSLPANHFDDT
jgi:hypothetical protein